MQQVFRPYCQNLLNLYPSEDAVVLGASVEILKLLFPGDQDYINLRAEEHIKKARLIAGANVWSDSMCRRNLRQTGSCKVHSKGTWRPGRSSCWQRHALGETQSDCIARGEVPWISQETPERPPMLPLFGAVRTFLFDSLTMVTSITSGLATVNRFKSA